MIASRLLCWGLSIVGTLSQLGIVVGMGPPDWSGRYSPWSALGGGHTYFLYPVVLWAPHFENLGEGRPAFQGRRCPGRQQVGTPFWIEKAPLPADYDPYSFPHSDVIACVRLDERGEVEGVQIVDGTGRAALDRRLLHSLFRQWRFTSVDGAAPASRWQRVRLNSAYRPTALPPPRPEPLFM